MRTRIGLWLALGVVGLAGAGLFAFGDASAAPDKRSPPTKVEPTGLHRALASVARFMAAPSPSITSPVTTPIPKGKLIVTDDDQLPDSAIASNSLKIAASVLHWKVRVLSFNTSDPTTLNSLFQASSVGSPKPDLVIGAVDSALQTWPVGLHALSAAHIPVIMSATGDSVGNGIIGSIVTTNDLGETNGVMEANWVIADSKGHANVAIFTLPFLSSVEGIYQRSISTYKHNCQACTIATVNISASQLAGGQINQVITDYLLAHPAVRYVQDVYLAGSPGLGAALQAAGLNTKVKVDGVLPSVDELHALKTGQIKGAIGCTSTTYIGWYEADAAVRYFTHQSLRPSETASAPVQLYDKSNLKHVPNGECTTPNNRQEQRYFTKLWGIRTSR